MWKNYKNIYTKNFTQCKVIKESKNVKLEDGTPMNDSFNGKYSESNDSNSLKTLD